MRLGPPVVALVGVAMVLGGCATPAGEDPAPVPTLSPLSTATPSPTSLRPPPIPEPQAGTIVIGGTALTIYPKDGSAPRDLLYSGPGQLFIDTLSDMFGAEPVVTEAGENGNCSHVFTKTEWGGFALISEPLFSPPGTNFEVVATSPSEEGIEIVSSVGVGVGDDRTAVYASQPIDFKYEVPTSEGDPFFYLYFDVSDVPVEGDSREAGAYMWGADKLIEGIAAPELVGAAEGC